MAIGKEKTLKSGATGDYWRILSVNIDRQNLDMTGRIALFKDKATSDAGGTPLGGTKVFNFPFTLAEFAATPNAIAFMYGKIRTYAETMINFDINGEPLDTPVPRDPDLAGGEMV